MSMSDASEDTEEGQQWQFTLPEGKILRNSRYSKYFIKQFVVQIFQNFEIFLHFPATNSTTKNYSNLTRLLL